MASSAMFLSSITVGAKSPPFVGGGTVSDADAALIVEFIAEMRRIQSRTFIYNTVSIIPMERYSSYHIIATAYFCILRSHIEWIAFIVATGVVCLT
jgi:hypothetical protein